MGGPCGGGLLEGGLKQGIPSFINRENARLRLWVSGAGPGYTEQQDPLWVQKNSIHPNARRAREFASTGKQLQAEPLVV